MHAIVTAACNASVIQAQVQMPSACQRAALSLQLLASLQSLQVLLQQHCQNEYCLCVLDRVGPGSHEPCGTKIHGALP